VTDFVATETYLPLDDRDEVARDVGSFLGIEGVVTGVSTRTTETTKIASVTQTVHETASASSTRNIATREGMVSISGVVSGVVVTVLVAVVVAL